MKPLLYLFFGVEVREAEPHRTLFLGAQGAMHQRCTMGSRTRAYAEVARQGIAKKRRIDTFRIHGDNTGAPDAAMAAQDAQAIDRKRAFLECA